MLPNVAFLIPKVVEYCSHFWSIGVKEQFYVIWPWLIKKSKNIFILLISIIIILIGLKIGILLIQKFIDFNVYNKIPYLIGRFLDSFRIQCMAIGGIVAYLLQIKSPLLKYIYDIKFQILTYSTIAILLLFKIDIGMYKHEVYSILFSIIIVNISANSNSILKLEYNIFKYLGYISFGIYMYHPIVLIASLKTSKIFSTSETEFNIIYYCLVLIFAIAIPAISYELFEKRFLKIKTKYAIIKT